MEDEIKNACLRIVSERIMPTDITKSYENYYKKERINYIMSSFGGILITSTSIPFIMSKLFPNKLSIIIPRSYKSHNIITGGMLSLLSFIITHDIMAYFNNKKIYTNYKNMPLAKIFKNKVLYDDLELELTLERSGSKIIINGGAKVTKNNEIVFEGIIRCDGINCELIRDNNNNGY